MQTDPSALFVLDTHAGAGRYDFMSDAAMRSPEYQFGIVPYLKTATASAGDDSYARSVHALNPHFNPHAGKPLRWYPGSPYLIAQRLRPQDRAVFCELQPRAVAALRLLLGSKREVKIRAEDGYAAAASLLPPKDIARALVLIDPPFETSSDYKKIIKTLKLVAAKMPSAAFLIWVPLKDPAAEACLDQIEALFPQVELQYAENPGPGALRECAMAFIPERTPEHT